MIENSGSQLSRQFIIIDDSGDPGVDGSSTSHFIVAAVIILSETERQKLIASVDQYRHDLGWKETHEFKFNSTKKEIVENLISNIQRHNISAFAMVLDKTKIPVTPDIIDSNSLYYYVIKELLLKLNLKNPHITIDGIGGKRYMQKIRSYLRQNLKASGIEKCEIKFADSKKDSLIQVADIIAGSVARSFRADKTDAGRYLEKLGNKIVKIYEMEF
jgi:regulator of PEP synthase PpsR (kinase-PPPase family)